SSFAGPAQSYGLVYPLQGGMYPSMSGPCLTLPSAPFQPYFCPPHPCLPSAEGMVPGQPARPGEPGVPSQEPRREQPGEPPRPAEEPGRTDMTTATPEQEPSLTGVQGAAGAAENVALGYNGASDGAYIDTALPLTQYRLRFETGDDANRP